MTPEKGLEKYLINKIKKSGYPLEIEISNLLDRDYVVFNTQYYFDEDFKQGRDIDIYAVPLYFSRDDELTKLENDLEPFKVNTELFIECKKSATHAWIFYTRDNIKVNGYHVSGQFKTSVPELKKFSPTAFEWIISGCLSFHYYNFDRVAVAYDEVKKQKKDKDKQKNNKSRKEIFEAVNQLVKCICFETHQIFERISNIHQSPTDYELLVFFFPIIVFDGDMFEVTFDSGEPKLKRTNHIILKTNYRCPYCKKVESFTIDVVHASFFSNFLKILRKDSIELRENMLKKHEDLIKSDEENRRTIRGETTEGTFG